MTELELADFYDAAEGGWGKWQKAAVAADNEWALRRARTGDAGAKEAVLFTLEKQRALLDPVWGGIYQYSAASDWQHPHFEKLMTFQAGALANYADAYALTRDARWLGLARAMRGYIDAFLRSPDGGFFATQDADLNAHEPGKRYLTGHEYYPLDDAHRRALGIPRVDSHEYGRENGLAIAAYVAFFEATGDARGARRGRAGGEAGARDARDGARRNHPRRGRKGLVHSAPGRQRGVRARADAASRGDEERGIPGGGSEDRRLPPEGSRRCARRGVLREHSRSGRGRRLRRTEEAVRGERHGGQAARPSRA